MPQRVVGRYALFGEIASGGMATVHYGRLLGPAGFSRTVAIKRLHPHFARNPEFVSMFLDEARLAARVRHPNVVSTLDVVAVDEEVFLIMDFVLGESLAKVLHTLESRGLAVPPEIAATIMTGVLSGLHAAHESRGDDGELLGLVHRDVSPQNILVGTDGVARVLDFGIAKASASSHHTEQGILKGKIGYLAPEQLREEPVDRRADIYAATVVLWEMLTGRRLFKATAPESAIHLILSKPHVAPSETQPEISPLLDDIVMKGLSRDPNDRYSTARDMAMALESSVPPATASQVGAWIEQVAGAPLQARASRIAAIESSPSMVIDTGQASSETKNEATSAQIPAAKQAAAQPAAAPIQVAHTPLEPGKKGARIALAAVVAGIIAVGGLGLLGLQKSSSPAATSSSAAASAVASSKAPAASASNLGIGSCTNREEAPNYREIVSGPASRSTCALTADGSVTCWGENKSGQLGTGDTQASAKPVSIPKLNGARQLAAGNNHVCAILESKQVACWGKELFLKPTTVIGLSDISLVAPGGSHACALRGDGSVLCWGDSTRGQLGTVRPAEGLSSKVDGIPKAKHVASGTNHACAIAEADGSVYCWGDDTYGQLGRGTADTQPHPKAVKVAGIAKAVKIAGGDKTTFALLDDGSVWGWGFGIKKPVRLPLTEVKQITAGGKHNCATRKDGTVLCWGFNDFGQLGEGTTEDSAAPLLIKGVSGAKSVTAGEQHTCAVLSTGAIVCWGGNEAGQLGLGQADRNRHERPSPIQDSACR